MARDPLGLTFVCTEFPHPPVHGGRADTWQRLRAFSSAGVRLQLVCWYSDRRGGAPSEESLAAVRAICADVLVAPVDLGPADLAWRLLNLWRWPSLVAARVPRGGLRAAWLARIRAFDPDALWLDGIWAGAFVRQLAGLLARPYFLRSHNVEHRYMARQATLADSFAYRMRLNLTRVGLERFEQRVMRDAAVVFDISTDDLRYWKSRGIEGGRWLPPFIDAREPLVAGPKTEHDVVFVGNLHTPNNVEALRWLIERVWPRVQALRPGTSALLAGSSPSDDVRGMIAGAAGLQLLADPQDVWPIYASARVLINPARSGSGVNIKSVEMLGFEKLIISTPVGVGGLPPEIRAEFVVADDPEDFAAAICTALDGGMSVNAESRRTARQAFAPAAIESVLQVIRSRLAEPVA